MRQMRINYTVMIDYTYDADQLPDDWDSKSTASKHTWLRNNAPCTATNMKEMRAIVDSNEVFPEVLDADVLSG